MALAVLSPSQAARQASAKLAVLPFISRGRACTVLQANASTILQLPGVCSSSGSSSVSPLPPDFADCAAAAAFSELHPRLSTQRGVGLLLLERPHTFVFPSNSRPQYYGRKEACCCCRCVEIARAGKAKESVASEREASFDEHLKQGCCCGRCFVCVPTPTRHAAATACAVRMLRRMLKLRGVPDAASLETNSQMDVDEEEARGVSGLGMVEGEKDAEWSFPSFPVDSAEGSSCRDTADICPGEEGLLQTSTGLQLLCWLFSASSAEGSLVKGVPLPRCVSAVPQAFAA